jgi:hypothetical protein
MVNGLSAWLGWVLLLTPGGGGTSAPFPEITKEQLLLCEPAIQAWLNETTLSDNLEIVRPRVARHPDLSRPRTGHRLDFRWLAKRDNHDGVKAEFVAFANAFEAKLGESLSQKLLYKFAHLCRLPIRSASVHISLLGAEVATYVDGAGKLVTNESQLRMADARAVVKVEPSGKSVWALVAPLVSKPIAVAKINTEAVASLLSAHFQGRGEFQQIEADDDWLRFEVGKLRGEVCTDQKFWERLEGTISLQRSEREVVLLLHLDGQFAPDGAASPAASGFRDMEPFHAKPLTTYARKLLNTLRSKLPEPAHE